MSGRAQRQESSRYIAGIGPDPLEEQKRMDICCVVQSEKKGGRGGENRSGKGGREGQVK